MTTRLVRSIAFFVAFALSLSAAPAFAAGPGGSVDGYVLDQGDGLPILAASVELFSGDTLVQSVKSDARGEFRIDGIAAGGYVVSITAPGYQSSQSHSFVVTDGHETSINVAINRATETQSGSLKTIGRVSSTSASTIASTTTITRTIDPGLLLKENYLRFVDGVYHLPGVNAGSLSSSVGDDTGINIRGLGSSETQALLDGHPVGPQGVYGINGGGSFPSSFNYADSPLFGLSKVQVTFGSGASGLYGVDAIGGTVDMETLNPTTKPVSNFSQSFGDQGRLQTAFNTTGTAGRLGYALAAGVQGTYGMFSPSQMAQTGRPNNNPNLNNGGACTQGNDISPCNLALNTYSVSQNVTTRSGLAKLRYNLSNNTTFTSTVFASGQQADSTGNGDNDNIPYDTRLAQVQSHAGNCSLPTDTGGATSGYAVITVSNAATPTACYSAAQFAKASFGPYGGGEDRNRGTGLSDYDFRLTSTSGKNTLTADGFYNRYTFYKSSEEAGGLDPTGMQLAGTAYTQFLNTQGYLLADDIQNASSELGFGVFGEYQLGTRKDYNVAGQGLFSYDKPESSHYSSAFARASYDFSKTLSAFGNFWVKRDSVIGDTNFDPRISLVLRPESRDIFRVTYGHSTGDPAAELKASGPPTINGNPSSLNPTCTPFNTIGSGGNPKIMPERSNDYEVGYAHRFDGDSSVQLNLYYTGVQNQLFSASEPLSQFGAVSIAPSLLQGFASKIGGVCPGVDPNTPASVLPFLAIATTFNAASATSKGIELSGRERLTHHVYFDYSYDVQSVVERGINDNILQNNATVVEGGQVQGIPINQASVGLDYANGTFETRLDGFVVGKNNPSNRPAYNYWNGFITRSLPNGLGVTLGVQNVFNEAWQTYGYFGHAPVTPENHFFGDTTGIQQYLSGVGNEEYGIPEPSFQMTLNYRV